MPLYSYECEDCHSAFELLVRASDTPTCPACGSAKLAQQVAKISEEIKYHQIKKSWRQVAARAGELSNFDKKEVTTLKS